MTFFSYFYAFWCRRVMNYHVNCFQLKVIIFNENSRMEINKFITRRWFLYLRAFCFGTYVSYLDISTFGDL